MLRQAKEDLVRQRTISACIVQSYLTQSWIQEYKELALILELLYSQNRVCVHFLGWEVGVMRWMVHDTYHHEHLVKCESQGIQNESFL